MAAYKSAQNPYKWPNGTWHSRPYNTGAGAPKSAPKPTANYVPTPSGRIGINTQAAMEAIAARSNPISTPSPPPFNADLEARRASNEARRRTLLSDLDVDLTQTAQETGFQYNPVTGAFGGFDPTNPFSQAALLQKTREEATRVTEMGYERARRGTQQSLALAGQLYSGAYQSAQAENDRIIGETRKNIQFDYDRGYDTLRRGFDDYVKRYLRRKRDIQTVNPEELASL